LLHEIVQLHSTYKSNLTVYTLLDYNNCTANKITIQYSQLSKDI